MNTAPPGVDTTKPSPDADAAPPPPANRPALDAQGRFRVRGRYSAAVVGAYLFLLVLVVAFLPHSSVITIWWAPWVIGIFLVGSLGRYLSTSYRVDDTSLRAWRVLGGRRVRLDEVRKIEYASLRDLAPTGGLLGSWGWRGRMWSPVVGRFDSIYTDASRGLLVSAGDVPLYISPRDPEEFARELSRRVRSYSGRLAVDVGDPHAAPTPPVF